MPRSLSAFLFLALALACLTPWVGSAMALFLGLLLSLSVGNPYSNKTKSMTHRLLVLSVVGLGAGMNLRVIGTVGLHGIGYTVIGISVALLVGAALGRALQTERESSLLITVGTAICGGSAIAAVAPVIKAKHHAVSVALGTVFTLNALALFIFPWIGHRLHLDESQFGLWSALAIHDTSSVVGAGMRYGAHALEVGTTIKLARALWIVPVAGLIGMIESRKTRRDAPAARTKKPWFILGFLAMAGLVTFFPELKAAGHVVDFTAKRLMVLTLFLIGSGLNRAVIKEVGFRPFVQGIALWMVMACGTLAAVYLDWIRV